MSEKGGSLDPGRAERILALIRAGAFPWVAAQAEGVSPEEFRLLTAGRDPRCATFGEDVKKALAMNRARTEIELREKNPLSWLRYGPGRPSPDGPGWTQAARVDPSEGSAPSRAQCELWEVLARFRRFWDRHPEARLEFTCLLEETSE